MIIRDATPDDLPDIIRMGQAFFEASGYNHITTADSLSMIQTAENLMDGANTVLLIAELDGEVVGMAGAQAFPFFFNTAHTTSQELFWWVDEPHRGSGAGGALMAGLESWAKRFGAGSIIMESINDLHGEAVNRLYRRAGYKPSGNQFVKALRPIH